MLSLRPSSGRDASPHVPCPHRACPQMRVLLRREARLRGEPSPAPPPIGRASRCSGDDSKPHRPCSWTPRPSPPSMGEWVVFSSACEVVANSRVGALAPLVPATPRRPRIASPPPREYWLKQAVRDEIRWRINSHPLRFGVFCRGRWPPSFFALPRRSPPSFLEDMCECVFVVFVV